MSLHGRRGADKLTKYPAFSVRFKDIDQASTHADMNAMKGYMKKATELSKKCGALAKLTLFFSLKKCTDFKE